MAPAKYEFLSSGQVVGLDIGRSAVAIVGDDAVGLEKFAPSVEQPWKQMRVLQRAQDRSRRAMNPGNFGEDGTIKRGPKRWAKSGHYERRQHKLADLERCLAGARERDHGELANKILGLGNLVQIEKLSYKGLQKNFGRSAKVRASGMFVSLLTRKAESAGGKVVELNTWTLKMSQYDHQTGVCTKKPLSQRWHTLGKSNTLVQRDCYSAFLAKNVIENQHKPSQLREDWAAAEPLLRRAGLCLEQSKSGERNRSPTVEFKPLPSDQIARRRRFVRSHARDAVAGAARSLREPANASQSAFRTPRSLDLGTVQHIDFGSVLQVRAPSGHFYLDRGDAPVVLIGGRVRITPMLSLPVPTTGARSLVVLRRGQQFRCGDGVSSRDLRNFITFDRFRADPSEERASQMAHSDSNTIGACRPSQLG